MIISSRRAWMSSIEPRTVAGFGPLRRAYVPHVINRDSTLSIAKLGSAGESAYRARPDHRRSCGA